MVASAFSAGAETTTRLAPAPRCRAAFSLAVKMPVHSSAMSTPSSFHGSLAGSRSAETLILPWPTLIESPSTVTVPGKRPWTESKRSRCALVSTGPRSLIPTTSISLRPDSAMARSTLRPMRPNPLIATRIAMLVSPLKADAIPAGSASHGDSDCGSPGSAGRERKMVLFRSPFSRRSQLFAQALQNCINRGLSGNSKVLEKVLGRRAGAEAMHADKCAILADHGVPAPAYRGLDRDLDRGLADDRLLLVRRLRQQQFERGHRHHPRRNAALRQLLLRGDRDLDLGARGEYRHLGLALCCDQFIGAVAARIVCRGCGAQLRKVLAGQRQYRRPVDAVEREFPALRDFDCVAGTEHPHIGNGAQRGEVFDRLMRRSIFAKPDRIVGHHIDDAGAHQRREPHRRTGIISEHQEGRAIGCKPAMQEDA